MKHLVLIDAHSIIYRCHFGPSGSLNAPSGEPTKATFGFMRKMRELWEKLPTPTHVITAFDPPKDTLLKRKVAADYKAKRGEIDEDLPPQIKRCRLLTKMMGAHRVMVDGYEADDIIASAVNRFLPKVDNISVVTCDKDMLQLVQGEEVQVYHPFEMRYLAKKDMIAKWGVKTAKQVLEVMNLCGDMTDNVRGVPKIGQPTAAKLIHQYLTAKNVQKSWKRLTPALGQSVKAADLTKIRSLVALLDDAPLKSLKKYEAPKNLFTTDVRTCLYGLGFNAFFKKS